jgi:hypothetical protein
LSSEKYQSRYEGSKNQEILPVDQNVLTEIRDKLTILLQIVQYESSESRVCGFQVNIRTRSGKVNSRVYVKKTCEDHLKAIFLNKPTRFILLAKRDLC